MAKSKLCFGKLMFVIRLDRRHLTAMIHVGVGNSRRTFGLKVVRNINSTGCNMVHLLRGAFESHMTYVFRGLRYDRAASGPDVELTRRWEGSVAAAASARSLQVGLS